MVNLFTLALFAIVFSLSAVDSKGSVGLSESTLATVELIDEPLLATTTVPLEKRQLGNLSGSLLSTIFPVKAQGASVTVTARLSFKRVRVHGYLTDTLNSILPHTNTIRGLCARADKTDPEQLSWGLVTELRAILRILKGCLYQVKDCGTAPSPSGIPGGRTPTLEDICQLFFKIMCEIRECCKLIGALCIKYKSVRRVCQDTLKQMTGCLSSIAVRCGVEIGDMSIGLGRLFATTPNFFADVQFGFSGFPSIFANGYGTSTLNLTL